MSAKTQSTTELLLEIIQRQAEAAQMLVSQGELLAELKDKLEELEQTVNELATMDWEE